MSHVAEASHVPALADSLAVSLAVSLAGSLALALALALSLAMAMAMAMSLAISLAMVGWQSHVSSNSIYSPDSFRRNQVVFTPKRHYFTGLLH